MTLAIAAGGAKGFIKGKMATAEAEAAAGVAASEAAARAADIELKTKMYEEVTKPGAVLEREEKGIDIQTKSFNLESQKLFDRQMNDLRLELAGREVSLADVNIALTRLRQITEGREAERIAADTRVKIATAVLSELEALGFQDKRFMEWVKAIATYVGPIYAANKSVEAAKLTLYSQYVNLFGINAEKFLSQIMKVENVRGTQRPDLEILMRKTLHDLLDLLGEGHIEFFENLGIDPDLDPQGAAEALLMDPLEAQAIGTNVYSKFIENVESDTGIDLSGINIYSPTSIPDTTADVTKRSPNTTQAEALELWPELAELANNAGLDIGQLGPLADDIYKLQNLGLIPPDGSNLAMLMAITQRQMEENANVGIRMNATNQVFWTANENILSSAYVRIMHKHNRSGSYRDLMAAYFRGIGYIQ